MLTNTAFQDFLENLYEELKSCTEGNVADYIPQLAKVNADDFGIAIATVDGHVYQVGDSQTRYSIQSISKAFTYGIALQDQGIEAVFRRVDVEPSGEAFNSISLEPDTGRPRNPMINEAQSQLPAWLMGKPRMTRYSVFWMYLRYTRVMNWKLMIRFICPRKKQVIEIEQYHIY